MKFIKPIFLGMIAAGGALVFELLVSGFFPENNFSEAALSLNIIFPLLAAAAIEEFFKLLVIYKSFYPHTNFNKKTFINTASREALSRSSENAEFVKVGVGVYLQKNSAREFLYSSLFLGFGFSLAEIAISNYFSIFGDLNLYLGILGIIFIHTLSAGLIGWLLLKIKKISFFSLALILFAATLLHFSYNAAIISGYLQK